MVQEVLDIRDINFLLTDIEFYEFELKKLQTHITPDSFISKASKLKSMFKGHFVTHTFFSFQFQ